MSQAPRSATPTRIGVLYFAKTLSPAAMTGALARAKSSRLAPPTSPDEDAEGVGTAGLEDEVSTIVAEDEPSTVERSSSRTGVEGAGEPDASDADAEIGDAEGEGVGETYGAEEPPVGTDGDEESASAAVTSAPIFRIDSTLPTSSAGTSIGADVPSCGETATEAIGSETSGGTIVGDGSGGVDSDVIDEGLSTEVRLKLDCAVDVDVEPVVVGSGVPKSEPTVTDVPREPRPRLRGTLRVTRITIASVACERREVREPQRPQA